MVLQRELQLADTLKLPSRAPCSFTSTLLLWFSFIHRQRQVFPLHADQYSSVLLTHSRAVTSLLPSQSGGPH